jgi:hypothetical protein
MEDIAFLDSFSPNGDDVNFLANALVIRVVETHWTTLLPGITTTRSHRLPVKRTQFADGERGVGWSFLQTQGPLGGGRRKVGRRTFDYGNKLDIDIIFVILVHAVYLDQLFAESIT